MISRKELIRSISLFNAYDFIVKKLNWKIWLNFKIKKKKIRLRSIKASICMNCFAKHVYGQLIIKI